MNDKTAELQQIISDQAKEIKLLKQELNKTLIINEQLRSELARKNNEIQVIHPDFTNFRD